MRNCKAFVFIVFVLLVGLMFVSDASLAQDVPNDKIPSVNKEVMNCESNLVTQDIIVAKALQQLKENEVLIVVVHLGEGENSPELGRRRVFNLREYFRRRGSRLQPSQVVIAQGGPVEARGRINYYLRGILDESISYPKNGYVCHSCCGPDKNFYPDKKSHQ